MRANQRRPGHQSRSSIELTSQINLADEVSPLMVSLESFFDLSFQISDHLSEYIADCQQAEHQRHWASQGIRFDDVAAPRSPSPNKTPGVPTVSHQEALNRRLPPK
ncbi:MAG: hypothetical protein P8M80_02815 [Pirellulaceae bacterium]|nr:hypothetical protein [Pirellulaceae bacterium]